MKEVHFTKEEKKVAKQNYLRFKARKPADFLKQHEEFVMQLLLTKTPPKFDLGRVTILNY